MGAILPPTGTSLFIDANIFYYHFVRSPDLSDWSSDVIENVAAARLTAFTSPHCLAEAIHKIMCAEAAQRFSLPRQAIVNHLRHHPERISELNLFREAATELARLPLSLLAIDSQALADAAQVSSNHGIMTNDAITIALMHRYGLHHLATNDEDFHRIPALTLWKPRSV
ncbi:MAG TPA: type II toxin-antitoxin system VapC family toxin [Tepidisphaeraceae bacterium]|jgi:predicted nucleic acid-binding protein|nr:type II toxin-antitoxin system VapC family toxin [Tepidisphaeraceae bacterium]